LEDVILKKDVLGRVKTPRERREALLAEFDRSGMSGQKFAAWAGIKYATFAHWRQQRRKQQGKASKPPRKSPVRWLEAVVTNPTPVQESARSKTVGILVHGPGGVWIEINEARQVSLAVQLLRELKRGC
jgi:transposase